MARNKQQNLKLIPVRKKTLVVLEVSQTLKVETVAEWRKGPGLIGKGSANTLPAQRMR